MNKPEALRLADVSRLSRYHEWHLQVDAELRRQHGEIKSMQAERMHTERRLLAVEAQRDALLEALRLMMDCAGVIATAPDIILEIALTDGDEETRLQANAFLVARAAIKAAEETK